MKVADVLTPDARVALLETHIGDAARLMAELDLGALLMSDSGQLADYCHRPRHHHTSGRASVSATDTS